jgi:hypothetical protein
MESPGFVEVFLPLQKLNIDSIIVSPPTSLYPIKIPTANISYKHENFTLPKLSIFTPFLTVTSWDPVKGRLDLVDNLHTNSLEILQNLQDFVINCIIENPEWSNTLKISFLLR